MHMYFHVLKSCIIIIIYIPQSSLFLYFHISQSVTVILMVRWWVLTVRHLGASVCVCRECGGEGAMSAALEHLTSLPLDAQVRQTA